MAIGSYILLYQNFALHVVTKVTQIHVVRNECPSEKYLLFCAADK